MKHKINLIIQEFENCTDSASIYKKIISKGQSLPPFPNHLKTEEHRVFGCQSMMYLALTEANQETIVFTACSDALISQGLAALLLCYYNHESPKTLFSHPPLFLKNMGILKSLSPNRAQGALSLYQKMQRLAAPFVC